MFRPVAHLVLHVAVPALVARFGFRVRRAQAFVVMLATMLVDLDHLLAVPVYDPDRCSLGTHPLHALWLQPLYLLLAGLPRTRRLGVGLVIHMALDALDCAWQHA